MGFWQDKLKVHIRDFAYANHGQFFFRMAQKNIGDVSAPTFASLLSGPVVNVYVGQQRRCWTIHRNLLCHHSDALAKELLPAETDSPDSSPKHHKDAHFDASKGGGNPEITLELLDQDPIGFELLVKYLYQGRLDPVSGVLSDHAKYDYAVACHRLYKLCARLGMPYLKNQAIDEYRQGLAEAGLVPDAEEINEIYRTSPRGSPFRTLMVKIAARQIMDPYSDRNADSYRVCFEDNVEFAIELVNAVKEETGGVLFDDPTELVDCQYHDHSAGVSCHLKDQDEAPLSPSEERSVTPPSLSTSTTVVAKSRSATPSTPMQNEKDRVTETPKANGLPQLVVAEQSKPPDEVSASSSSTEDNSGQSTGSKTVNGAPQASMSRRTAVNDVRSGAGHRSSDKVRVNGFNRKPSSPLNGFPRSAKSTSQLSIEPQVPDYRPTNIPNSRSKGPPKLRKQIT